MNGFVLFYQGKETILHPSAEIYINIYNYMIQNLAVILYV